MNDMDENSRSLGGVVSFFANEYEKYSWKNLLNKKNYWGRKSQPLFYSIGKNVL